MKQSIQSESSIAHRANNYSQELDTMSMLDYSYEDSSQNEESSDVEAVLNPITEGLNDNTLEIHVSSQISDVRSLRADLRIDHAVLLFCILFFMTFLILKIDTLDRSEQMQDTSMSPYTVPSLSPAPTTHYVDFLKDLVSPISGKDILEDPDTIQNFVLHKIAASMPKLVSKSIVDISNKKQIIQRYVQTVVQLSLLGDPAPVKQHILDRGILFGQKCDRYICNEDDEITVVEMRNQWSTSRGRGTIAIEIGYLPKLTHILLYRNALHGTIPSEIGLLKNLVTIDIRENYLSGTIPTELGQSKNLESLFFNSNALQGNIPSDIGKLKNLEYMDLSRNLLTGSIPERLANCEKLRGFAIYYNSLSGNAQFLCDKNFTNEIFVNEVVFNSRIEYSHTIKTSLITDCKDKKTIFECSCCTCV